MKRLIIFLIRKRLGLKKNQRFTFDNQKSKFDEYYFTDTQLMKCEQKLNKKINIDAVKWELEQGKIYEHSLHYKPSSCSLNWLLSDECQITKK